MQVRNNSSDPVNWEQSGSGPAPQGVAAAQQGGQLQSGTSSGDFNPVGEAPYSVKFTNVNKPSQTADSGKFDNPSATVTLNDDWTVTVS